MNVFKKSETTVPTGRTDDSFQVVQMFFFSIAQDFPPLLVKDSENNFPVQTIPSRLIAEHLQGLPQNLWNFPKLSRFFECPRNFPKVFETSPKLHKIPLHFPEIHRSSPKFSNCTSVFQISSNLSNIFEILKTPSENSRNLPEVLKIPRNSRSLSKFSEVPKIRELLHRSSRNIL